MRMWVGIIVLVFAQGLAGCDSRSPVPPTALISTPSPTDHSPTPGTVGGEGWNLTTRFTSVTGPGMCVSGSYKNIGQSRDWLMTIQRSGESIDLATSAVSDPTEVYAFAGTEVADELSATSAIYPGATLCGGSRFDYRADWRVSGRFSPDGHALTAEEVDSYQLTSGETLVFRYEWSASRQ